MLHIPLHFFQPRLTRRERVMERLRSRGGILFAPIRIRVVTLMAANTRYAVQSDSKTCAYNETLF